MKRSIIMTALISSVCFMTSCIKEPEAGFTYDTDDLVAQQEIKFTNTSNNSSSYEWDFGDGTDPVDKVNPTHLFEKSGNYTVTLTAISKSGTNTYTEDLEIERPVSLFPGVAAANFELGEEWSSVNNKLSDGYEHYIYYFSDYDLYLHDINDIENNILIEMIGSSADQNSDDYILDMVAYGEFDGATEKGVGLGDKTSVLTSVYGTPDQTDSWSADGFNSFDYDALGISFIKKSGASSIFSIVIYPTSSKSSKINMKRNIPAKAVKEIVGKHFINN
jgi:PKD repeat protein